MSLILYLFGRLSGTVTCLLIAAGGSVALIGWLDDKKGLPIRTRFGVHVGAALVLSVLLVNSDFINIGVIQIQWGNMGVLFFTLGGIWLINLYNFMDGIDGLAASEAIIVCLAGCGIMAGTQADTLAFIAGMAVLGFLPWNWPPAKVFMGDIGSGFLGFLVACLWILSTPIPGGFFIWPVLSGVFIVDATLTLLRRIYRKERWYASHRSHIYQVAAMRWGHTPVTKTVILINLFWLVPCAVLCRIYPEWSLLFTIIAYTPLFAVYVTIRRRNDMNVKTDSGNPQTNSGNP